MAADLDIPRIIQKVAPLPFVSLLVATGMYILNDLVDADLDRANGKKRPIPSGQVSKRQAWIFVLSTNGLAVALSAATLSIASVAILLPMLAIGIMYSVPRIALMNRFIVKTLSIAAFYALCALLGITSGYGIGLASESPLVPAYSMAVLGLMIFISSTLNDLGDVEGDRAAKRRTIPIVMGTGATIRFLTVLAGCIVALSLVAYPFVGAITVAFASIFAALVISKLRKIGEGITRMDTEAIRREHKRIFPMHLLLQLLLGVGAILVL
jgi:4-hydroxybenzoate polyprenyltransferase